MENRRLRATILNLQDRLSSEDRQRLHFYLKNDVPRRVADNLTLNGTLKLIDALFDQDKINEKNLNLLIDALIQVRCLDAAGALKSYQQRMSSKGIDQSTMSLTSIMPPLPTSEEPSVLTKLFIDNDDEDKVPTSHFIANEINYKTENNSHNIIGSHNFNTNTTNINSHNGAGSSPKISQNRLYGSSSNKSKLFILILFGIVCVLATVLVFLLVKTLMKHADPTPMATLEELFMYKQKVEALENRTRTLENALTEAKKENTAHLIKPGQKFGLKSGQKWNMNSISDFDNSKHIPFTSSHYLSGIIMSGDKDFFFSCQFIYTSVLDRHNITTSIIPNFQNHISWEEKFYLDSDERIKQVGIQVRGAVLDLEDENEDRTNVITGLQFHTTKNRTFHHIDRLSSLKYESFPGYTLGYATGTFGRYIHQLQFYWYKTRESHLN